MLFGPYTTNERAESGGYTHWALVTADDLTTTATNTAQTLTTPLVFGVGDTVTRVRTKLKTPFQDADDAAFNTDTMSLGDSVGGVATILAAIELNVNGTEILNKTAIPTGTPSTGFTAATTGTITFNSMAAKALNNVDVGVLFVEWAVDRANIRPNAVSAGPILTK